MKIVLTFFMICSSASATTLGQYISTPGGTSVQKFEITSSKVEYEKRSNFFDAKKDLSLGKFTSVQKISSKEQNHLESTLAKIKTVDEILKKKSTSFNELSQKVPHESFFMLDDYRVSKQSDLYPELKNVYDSLASLTWKLETGVRLTDDYKTVIYTKDGKEISRQPFNFRFHCEKPEPPTQCMIKDYGILFLSK